MELKRDEIKYVRDLAKSAYQKDKECFICGKTDELQFHHFYSMTLLWYKWKKKHNIVIDTVDDILVERENFKGDHYKEIYADTVTLCKFHHMDRLHKLYGKVPALGTAEKQRRWCERQRIKHQETLDGKAIKK